MPDTLTQGAADVVGAAPLPLLPGAGGRRVATAGPGPGAAPPAVLGGDYAQQFAEQQKVKADSLQQIRNAATRRDEQQAPIAAQMAALPKPADPKYTELPQAPTQLQMSPKELQDFTSTMFAFAVIGGAMTRAPMTTALNAFSGALQGLREGSMEKFKQDSAAFKQNMDAAVAKNQQAHSEYTEAWNKHKNDMGTLMQQWQLIATKYNDTVALSTLQMKDASEMIKHIQNSQKMDMQMKKMDQQFNMTMARMAQAERHFQQRQGGGDQDGGISQRYSTDAAYKQQVDTWARMLKSGIPLPARFAQMVGKQFSADVFKVTGMSDAGSMIAARANQREIQAEAQKIGTQSASVAIANKEMERFIPLAESAIDRVPRTDWRPINQLIQGGENTWSPAQKQLVIANRSVQNAYAQLIQRGAPTVHSLSEAEKMLNTADSPEVYKAAMKQLRAEGTQAELGLRDVHEDLMKRAREIGAEPAGGPARISSNADYDKLASGTEFIAPDGSHRRKP